MEFFRIEYISADVNPGNNVYDVVHTDDSFIENQRVLFPLNSFPDKLLEPQNYSFFEGVQARDFISVPGLSERGLVLSSRAFNAISKLKQYKWIQVEFGIEIKGKIEPYHWLVYDCSDIFSQISYTKSSFYLGNTYWGTTVIKPNNESELISILKNQHSIKTSVSFDMITFNTGFDYDLFKFPRLGVRTYCSSRFIDLIAMESLNGLTFHHAKIKI